MNDIIKTKTWLDSFITQYVIAPNPNILVFDIEGDDLLDDVSKIHCIVIQNFKTKGIRRYGPSEINEALSILNKAHVLVGHNIIAYDLPTIRKLYPDILKHDIVVLDTLVASRFLRPRMTYEDMDDLEDGLLDKDKFIVYNKQSGKFDSAVGRHSLEAWGLRLNFNKGDFGQNNDFKVFTPEMLDYCEQDVLLNTKIFEELLKIDCPVDALMLELKTAEIIFRQEQHGWYFDKDKAQKLYEELKTLRDSLINELRDKIKGWEEETKTPEYYELKLGKFTITQSTKGEIQKALRLIKKGELVVDVQLLDIIKENSFKSLEEKIKPGPVKVNKIEFNPGSAHHIARYLKETYNHDVELSEKGEPLVNEAVLESLKDKFPECNILLRYEVVQDRLEKLAEGRNGGYLTFEKNGRIHHYCNTIGALTYRAAHSAPNLAQVPSVRKGKDKQILLGEEGGWGYEFRSLFKASPGKVMVGTDASSQELRCLAHAMALYDKGEYAKEVVNGDIHTKNQIAAGLPTRDNAKTFIYACVTMDTEVLTESGWKNYYQIKEGEQVLTYNSEKGIKEWKPITKIVKYDNAEVIEIKQAGFKFKCTPNHRWFTKRRTGNKHRKYFVNEVCEARNLNSEHCIIVNAPYVTDKKLDCKTLLKGKYNIDLCKYALNMSKEELLIYLQGFLLADGYINKYGLWQWSQNKNNISDGLEIASYLANDGKVSLLDKVNSANGKAMRICSLSKKQHITCQNLKKIQLQNQSVWCLQTDNQSFIAKQGNTITITGNTIYGGGDAKIGDIVGKGVEEGRRIKEKFFKAIPALSLFMETQKVYFSQNYLIRNKDKIKDKRNLWKRKQGYIIGLDGRKVYGRQAYSAPNAQLQSMGAIITKRWMCFIDEELKSKGLDKEIFQLGWIHDELQFECPPDKVEILGSICKDSMKKVEEYYKFRCPLDCEWKQGNNWAETH